MHALVIYESMYGNTHALAEAIGRGLGTRWTASIVPVAHADEQNLAAFDLVVVGGPTHVHGMSRDSTRHAAADAAATADSTLNLDPDAAGVGVRDWLHGLSAQSGIAAAFDTRVDAPALVTGRASKGIAHLLERVGFELALPAQSFLVTKETLLALGEIERAEAWGSALGALVPLSGAHRG
ncbi:flavodoxin [Cryobacterium frigoriphilum]|uniref:Flavodoxin n=1 Tax=Cryobacterium frigoriphilum TaxID=1259150 RepID=A0A4R9AB13_9MICO|nr:flavodoxin domain-containing protein [Cryobacterium frigoriphilum]TFD54569.1 flavodoxin [Cryobacterium frigoriphilum]